MADLLSKDIWAIIMTFLPQAERLGACSLVCRKIRAAAAEATSDVSVVCAGQGAKQRVESMGSFLQQHGKHLTSLAFNYSGNKQVALPELPCARLRSLDISSESNSMLKLHWDATSNLSGVVHSCTALTSLKLSHCVLASDSADPLASLSVLVNLVDLKLASFKVRRTGDAPFAEPGPFPGSILPCLSRLTCIDLSGVDVVDVHCVSQLQHLSVLIIKDVPAEQQQVRLSGFVLPATLRHVAFVAKPFTGVVLELALFSAATQLSALVLNNLDIEGQGGISSGDALLAAMSKLQRLEVLNLHSFPFDATAWPPLSAAHEALTASSVLRELRMHTRRPHGVWLHAFPPSRIMRNMKAFGSGGILSAEEVAAVARSCPGLTKLSIFTTSDGADIVAAVKAIATLTSLCDLSVHAWSGVPYGFDESTLLPLTALRQLTYCRAFGVLDSDADEAMPDATPVWLRLVERCMRATSCQPAIKASLQQELAQLQQQPEVDSGDEEQLAPPTLQSQIEELLQQLQEGV